MKIRTEHIKAYSKYAFQLNLIIWILLLIWWCVDAFIQMRFFDVIEYSKLQLSTVSGRSNIVWVLGLTTVSKTLINSIRVENLKINDKHEREKIRTHPLNSING
jgi:hypothetical protein